MRNTKAARSFTFLTAFDSIIIPLLQGGFRGSKKEATTDGCLFHLVGVLTVRLIQSINLQVYTVQHCLYL